MYKQLLDLQAARRIVVVLLAFWMVATIANAGPPAEEGDGSKATEIKNTDGYDGSSKDKPILIADAKELAYLAQQVNKGENLTVGADPIDPKDKYFALSDNIDLNGKDWTPIGNTSNRPFKGHFDGNGHVIKGLKVNIENGNTFVYAGLFGNVDDGTICNLGIHLAAGGIKATSTNSDGNGYAYAGGIAGEAEGTRIYNCYVETTDKEYKISADAPIYAIAGGIVGKEQNGSLTHCYSTVDIYAKSISSAYAGGIAGEIIENNTTSYTYATGTVTADGGGQVYAGGIVGRADASHLKNNLALNENIVVIKIETNDRSASRIVGKNDNSTLSNNYASGNVKTNGSPISVSLDPGPASQHGGGVWFDNFEKVLKTAPADNNEWNSTNWDWSNEDLLPRLKTDKGGDFPTAQTPPARKDFFSLLDWSRLNAGEIKDETFKQGDNILRIATAGELAYLAKQVNEGVNELRINGMNYYFRSSGFPNTTFILTYDIDLKDAYWIPIGNAADKWFEGHFDGNGHVIKGLKIIATEDNEDHLPVGLFGKVEGGTISNLGVSLAPEGIVATATSMQGTVNVGGLAGEVIGDPAPGNFHVRNCYVTAPDKGTKITATASGVDGYARGGGIIGQMSGATIAHCYATVNVEAKGIYAIAGGIVGEGAGEGVSIYNTFATGNVRIKGSEREKGGGIVGYCWGTLRNNLALNKEISGTRRTLYVFCRVGDTGINGCSYNFASTGMQFNGDPFSASSDHSSNDGADTWLETFKADLQAAPATDNGWNSENWKWPASPSSTQLPQLRVVTTAADGTTGYTDWDGDQPTIDAAIYLKDPTPKPEPKPDPEPEPTPPPIYHTVTLPAVEGATTDPIAGDYEVEAWNSFQFYLTLLPDYDQSHPVVTTDRGETITPRARDGAYVVKYVRSDISITIDGITRNTDVANETIRDNTGPQVWTDDSGLCIRTDEAVTVRIVTASGSLVRTFRSAAGLTRLTLPAGFYIVRAGNTVCKVILK